MQIVKYVKNDFLQKLGLCPFLFLASAPHCWAIYYLSQFPFQGYFFLSSTQWQTQLSTLCFWLVTGRLSDQTIFMHVTEKHKDLKHFSFHSLNISEKQWLQHSVGGEILNKVENREHQSALCLPRDELFVLFHRLPLCRLSVCLWTPPWKCDFWTDQTISSNFHFGRNFLLSFNFFHPFFFHQIFVFTFCNFFFGISRYFIPFWPLHFLTQFFSPF